MHAAITAATGFLIAVLWFDLMFDVQVWPHRRADQVPDATLHCAGRPTRRRLSTGS